MELLCYCTYAFALLLAYYSLALSYHWLLKMTRSGKAKLIEKRLMVVFGSGGHTTEMLHMLKSLDPAKYGQVCFIVAQTDTWSLTKLNSFLSESQLKHVRIEKLYRAREVKQSYVTSVATTLLGLLDSARVIVRFRPDLIVSNGPGTAVPLCYASFLVQKCLLINPSAKLLYVESFCRVETLSLSGKLLKPVVDR